MNLYIGDTHFGHQNVIHFDHRPFSSVGEMDEVMIRLWNGRVQPDDDVWFLGDFCHKSGHEPEWYLRRLAGRKHLILGNHDQPLYENDTALAYFESVDQIARVIVMLGYFTDDLKRLEDSLTDFYKRVFEGK